MPLLFFFALIGVYILAVLSGLVEAQTSGQSTDAASLRGRLLTNPLSVLHKQSIGWDAALRKFIPWSYATQAGDTNYCAPTSAADNYTCTLDPAISAYSAGLWVLMKADFTNTGAATLALNGLSAKNIQKVSSGALTALTAGDIVSGVTYVLTYNGTVFVLNGTAASGAAGVGYCAPAGASTTTYTCALSPTTLTSYGSGGLTVSFKPDVTNTASSTLNIDSLGAKTLQKIFNGALTNLAAGDIVSGNAYLLVYNGTVLIVVDAGGTGTGLSVNPFNVVKTSSTRLTINTFASATQPANIGVGANVYQFTGSYTLDISGTSSTGSVYLCHSATNAAPIAKHNMSVTLTPSAGLTVTTASTSCGTDLQFAVITMTANVWDTITAAMDFRPHYGYKPSSTAGSGVTVTAANSDTIAATAATNNAGNIVWGLGFITLNTGTWYTWPAFDFVNVDSYAGPIPVACDAQNLRVYVPASVNAGGTIVATLRNVTAGSDTALTVTVSAGAAAGVYSDTTHTVTLTAASRYVLKLDNNSTASNSGGWAFSFQCK